MLLSAKLDVYRSCTWREKRQVLEAFWRTDEGSSPRIRAAALEYGAVAKSLLVVIAVEVALLSVFALATGHALGWVGGAVEIGAVCSVMRSRHRLRALRGTVDTN